MRQCMICQWVLIDYSHWNVHACYSKLSENEWQSVKIIEHHDKMYLHDTNFEVNVKLICVGLGTSNKVHLWCNARGMQHKW